MVEANLVKETKNNFNELKLLNVNNLIEWSMIKFLI